MILLWLILAILLFGAALYYGYWRLFFVFSLTSILFSMDRPVTIVDNVIHGVLIGIIVVVLLSFWTFFIHGSAKAKIGGNFYTYKLIWKILTILGAILWAGSAVVYYFYIVSEKAWHLFISFPTAMVMILMFIIMAMLFLFLPVMIYLNHGVIKWKYVVTLDPAHLELDGHLNGFRYRNKTEKVQLYAHESLFGAIYYRRKARENDEDIICDTVVTRFFEKLELRLVQKSERKKLKPKKWNGYYTIITLCILLVVPLLSAFASTNFNLRQQLNQNIFARDYQPTIGLGTCTKIYRDLEGNKEYRKWVYTFDCDVKYAGIEKKWHFSTSTIELAESKRSHVSKGFVVYYQPQNPRQAYSEVEDGNPYVFFFILIADIGILTYTIYVLRKRKRNSVALK